MLSDPNDATDDDWLRKYQQEYLTLEQVAAIAGITREGVRQRLKARGIQPRSLSETTRLRELRQVNMLGADIRAAFLRTRSLAETSLTVGLTEGAVQRYLERELPEWKVLTRLPRSASKRFTKPEMLQSLRDAASDSKTALTTNAYRNYLSAEPFFTDGRRRPGVQAYILRFSSWIGAVSAAGLSSNGHSGPSKEFDAASANRAVVDCWRDIGHAPSVAEYDRWQVGRDGRPSAATARKLLGSWPAVQVRAWQVVYGILLDQDDEDVVVPDASEDDDRLRDGQFLDYRQADEGTLVSLPDGYEVGEYNALERAVRSHARIQNEAAAAGQALGLDVLSPGAGSAAFDLALRGPDGTVYVVEVKSATSENLELQMRLGLGQVLMYAHRLRLQHTPVRPVLAIETTPGETWSDLLSTLEVGLVVAGRIRDDLVRILNREN